MVNVMIKKEHLEIWLKTTEEEVIRLKNCRDYINVVYYKHDAISYYVHELLLDIFGLQINKNLTVIEHIKIMLDFVDGKRLDTLLEFRDFSKPIVEGLPIDINSKLRQILMTPSTELNIEI